MVQSLTGTIEDVPRARAYLRWVAAERALRVEFGLVGSPERRASLVDAVVEDAAVRDALRCLGGLASPMYWQSGAQVTAEADVLAALEVLQERGLVDAPATPGAVSWAMVRWARRAERLLALVPGALKGVVALCAVVRSGPGAGGRQRDVESRIAVRDWLRADPMRAVVAGAVAQMMARSDPSPALLRALLEALGDEPLSTDYAVLVQADGYARALGTSMTSERLVELVEAGADLREVTGRPTTALATFDARRSVRRLTNPATGGSRVVSGGLPGLGRGGR